MDIFLVVIAFIVLIIYFSINPKILILDIIVVLFFFIIIISFIISSISFGFNRIFYGDLYYTLLTKPKFCISNEKINLELPITNKKNFEIRWNEFKLIEIKRGREEMFFQRHLCPNKIFSYKIIFYEPERTMNLNNRCQMFHIKKIAEIVNILKESAEKKNKEFKIDKEVKDFLDTYYQTHK